MHVSRLRYKDAYLQDRLTLEESKIYDNVAVELVPLATKGELQADLFWRYVPNKFNNDEPHLIALDEEIKIFNQETVLEFGKLTDLAKLNFITRGSYIYRVS